MVKNKHNLRGYSILELLAVIGIIALFTGISMPAFFNSSSEKKLEEDTKKVIDVIELAKSKTVSSDISGNACPVFDGYRVIFDAASYSLEMCCRNDTASAICSTNYLVSTFAIESDNTLATVNMPLDNLRPYILYKPLVLGTSLAGNATVKISNSIINKCIPITVDRLGIVTEGNKQPTPC